MMTLDREESMRVQKKMRLCEIHQDFMASIKDYVKMKSRILAFVPPIITFYPATNETTIERKLSPEHEALIAQLDNFIESQKEYFEKMAAKTISNGMCASLQEIDESGFVKNCLVDLDGNH